MRFEYTNLSDSQSTHFVLYATSYLHTHTHTPHHMEISTATANIMQCYTIITDLTLKWSTTRTTRTTIICNFKFIRVSPSILLFSTDFGVRSELRMSCIHIICHTPSMNENFFHAQTEWMIIELSMCMKIEISVFFICFSICVCFFFFVC